MYMPLSFVDRCHIAALYLGEHFTGNLFPRFFKQRIATFGLALSERMAPRVPGKQLDIDTLSQISPENFQRNYIQKQQPLLVKGMATNWPALRNWNFEFFRKTYGHNRVPKNNLSPKSYSGEIHYPQTNLADLLAPQNLNEHQLSFTESLALSPELLAAIRPGELRRYFPKISLLNDIRIFMAGRKFFTPIHAEIFGSLFIQVYGRKRWRLYPAASYPLLQPNIDRRYFMLTEAAPEKNAPGLYPLIQYADYYEVVLHPGDVLWFPPYTWHQVSNETDAIGVGYKYTSIPAAMRASAVLTVLNLFATRPALPAKILGSLFNPKRTVLRQA